MEKTEAFSSIGSGESVVFMLLFFSKALVLAYLENSCYFSCSAAGSKDDWKSNQSILTSHPFRLPNPLISMT